MNTSLVLQFLEALKLSLNGERVEWNHEITSSQWLQLLKKASDQHLLPLIFDTVYSCHSFQETGKEALSVYKPIVIQSVLTQTIKTDQFLNLYQYLVLHKLHPIVVKGLICRNLYPNPDARVSNDEDILIEPQEFLKCHYLLLKYGMKMTDEDIDIDKSYEVSYYMPNTTLCIEVHKYLFPTDSYVYKEYNAIFKDVYEKTITEDINGIFVRTLSHTDHFIYLICHALKHFVHSGVGIRQVCDIVMFANKNGVNINWNQVVESCRKLNAFDFMIVLIDIGKQYLNFDENISNYPKLFENKNIDSLDMLNDIMSGGVYGALDDTRLHSGTVTKNYLENGSYKNRALGRIISLYKTLFPRLDYMKKEYSFLNKYPFLILYAWGNRIYKYLRKSKDYKQSLKIAEQRMQLLRKYKIIK